MFIEIDKIPALGLEFDDPLEPAPAGEGEIAVLVGRATGSVRRGRRGIDLRARLEMRLRLQCSRCLEAYEAELRHDFALILVPEAVEFGVGEREMDPDDALMLYVKEGRADIQAIAREQIYLHAPLKPVCRPDCRGLCPTCGENRNRIECGCRSEQLDPRLAPLLEFKKRTGDS